MNSEVTNLVSLQSVWNWLLTISGQKVYYAIVKYYNRPFSFIMNALRRLIIFAGDPIVIMEIEGCQLKMNLSHQLPLYYRLFPTLDRALPRICSYIYEREGNLTFIDVGANIGDSVALITQRVRGHFLCIEGDSQYFKLLKKNTESYKDNIILENVFLGECDCKKTAKVERANGSLRVIESKSKDKQFEIRSLDSVLINHPQFRHANFVKVDTDGYDLRILRGSLKLLKTVHPCLFVEFYPELLKSIGDDPSNFFQFLYSCGYEKCLVYDNYGRPVTMLTSSDTSKTEQLIAAIDQNIFYYDILCIHRMKTELFTIFDMEFQALN